MATGIVWVKGHRFHGSGAEELQASLLPFMG